MADDSRPAEFITQRQQSSAVALIEGTYIIGEPTTVYEALMGLELSGNLSLRLFGQEVGEYVTEKGSRR